MPRKYGFLILIAVPLLVYINALNNSFQYDDLHTLVNNPHIRSEGFMDALKKIVLFSRSGEYYSGETHQGGHYRPLLYATYLMNYALTGLNPGGFRIINLGLHIGCAILVFSLARQLLYTEIGALLSALIFAIHPLFSESVNYISARSSSLATLFYILAFYLFLRLRSTEMIRLSRSLLIYALLSLASLLAFLSKEIAITLPLLFAVYDLLFTRPQKPQGVLQVILPYVLTLVTGLVLLYNIQALQMIRGIFFRGDFIEQYGPSILAQMKGLSLMVWLFILPWNLSIEHGISSPETPFEPIVIGNLLFLLGILGTAFFLIRTQRTAAFLIFWFFITALPTTLIPLNIAFLEHRGYLPGVGWVLLAGWGFEKIHPGPGLFMKTARPAILLVGFLLVFYIGMTLHRNTLWKVPVSLWSDAVAKAPHSDRAWTNLGLAHLLHKDHERARQAFRQALTLNPEGVIARVGLGSSYHFQGDLDKAITYYQEAITRYPHYFLSHFNLGVAYQQKGEHGKALQAYREGLRYNAHHPETHLNLGTIYFTLNRFDEAIAEYLETIRLNPRQPSAHRNLGAAYEAIGQVEMAHHHYQESEMIEGKSH